MAFLKVDNQLCPVRSWCQLNYVRFVPPRTLVIRPLHFLFESGVSGLMVRRACMQCICTFSSL